MLFFSLNFLPKATLHQSFALVLLCLVFGCGSKKKEEVRISEAPPALNVSESVSCSEQEPFTGAMQVERETGHCVPLNTDIGRYGLGSRRPLSDVCTQLFNGECELYKSFGLRGVTTAQLFPKNGGEYFVQLTLSQFQDRVGAYGFYSHRVLGQEHPRAITVRSLNVEGRAALGLGIAYLFRDQQVWELTYLSDSQTPQQVKAAAPEVLTQVTESLARASRGPQTPPQSVERLEKESGIWPLGVEFEAKDIWGLQGAGAGAIAYIREGIAHRLLLAVREDERGAKDLMNALLRVAPHRKIKGTNIYRVRKTLTEKDDERWYIERRGNRVIGVSRDLEKPLLLGSKERKRDEKEFESFAIKRLRKFK